MFTITIEKQIFKILLDALEIAASWHKNEPKFMRAHKIISDQVKLLS